jgi:hypothetical protein
MLGEISNFEKMVNPLETEIDIIKGQFCDDETAEEELDLLSDVVNAVSYLQHKITELKNNIERK